jgi:Holliday junction resolvase RusA-like endonuclease
MRVTFVVPLKPPSSNKGVKSRFAAAVREAAALAQGQTPLPPGPLYTRITGFHHVATTQDVDSIAKRIHDALIGIVYEDDFQVVQTLLSRIDCREIYELSTRGAPEDVLAELVELLEDQAPHILYVEVGLVPRDPLVGFGPLL